MTFFVFIGCGTAVSFSTIRPSAYTEGTSTTTDQTAASITNLRDIVINNSSFGINTALAFGTAIMVLAYSLGHISGGQFNPAVSLSLVLSGNLGVFQACANVCAQVVGSILAAGLLYGMVPDAGASSLGANAVSPGYTSGSALLGEIIMTAFLCFVVHMTVCDDENSSLYAQAPLAIGFAVFLAHTVLIPVDGCSINPARSLGPAIVSGNWKTFWVYIVGPFVGSFFGVFAWLLVAKKWNVENAMEEKINNATGATSANVTTPVVDGVSDVTSTIKDGIDASPQIKINV